MMTLLLLVLAADPVLVINPRGAPVNVGNSRDAGELINVYVAGQAAGAGGLTNTELRASPIRVLVDGGSISVANFPANQVVSGYVNALIDGGSISVANFPATQPVSGTVTVANPVTYVNALIDGGSITVANFPASQAVTMTSTTITGTVATSLATLPALVAGTANIGDVDVLTLPSVTIGTFPDNEPVSVSQINGNTVTVGAGSSAPGTQRVTLASDSPSFGSFNGSNPSLSSSNSGRAVAYGSSPSAVGAGNNAPFITDLEGIPYSNNGHPRSISCRLSTTATTSTQVTGCELVASNSIWITSITIGGGVATGATAPAIIQSGTSTACTGPVVLYYCGHIAQDTCVVSFPTPIKATVAHGLCILDATVGTKWVTITGYVAP